MTINTALEQLLEAEEGKKEVHYDAIVAFYLNFVTASKCFLLSYTSSQHSPLSLNLDRDSARSPL